MYNFINSALRLFAWVTVVTYVLAIIAPFALLGLVLCQALGWTDTAITGEQFFISLLGFAVVAYVSYIISHACVGQPAGSLR